MKCAGISLFARVCCFGLLFCTFTLYGAQAARPVISGFSPVAGEPGTRVTIGGQNFSGATEVRFGNGKALFSVVSSSVLTATVPFDATTGSIVVSGPGGFGVSNGAFWVAPRITSFSPVSVSAGDVVTIEGSNFTGTAGIQFGDVWASSFSVTADSQVHVVVPRGAKSGPIRVVSGAGVGLSVEALVVTGTEPVIEGFFPVSGIQGATITIQGRNFVGITGVRFNGVAAMFSVPAPTQIQAVVPAGATSGPIQVDSFGGSGVSVPMFQIANGPWISGFDPTNGPPGINVVIEGLNFGGVSKVLFHDGIPAKFSITSPTQILAVVPSGATNGPIQIESARGKGTSIESFRVISSPLVIGFEPVGGKPGTVVTIEGINFGGVTRVEFGGVGAVFSVVAPTQIVATVPAGAVSGGIRISSGFGIGLSEEPFVVNAGQPVIAAFSPGSGGVGTVVMIEGSGLDGASAVRFGQLAAEFSVAAPTQLYATVPEGIVTGKIRVTTAQGTGVSQSDFYAPPRITRISPGEAVAGGSVVIEGANFDDVSAVRFNGSISVYSVVSSRQIVAQVPIAARNGAISVTTPAGIVASAGSFVALPHAIELTPVSGPPGTEVRILGTHLGDAREVLFNGRPALFLVESGEAIRAIVPDDAVSGPVSVVTSLRRSETSFAFTVGVGADLRVTSSLPGGRMILGQSVRYEVVVINDGPLSATSVVLTNWIGGALRLESVSVSQGEITGTAPMVRWVVGELPASGQVRLSAMVLPVSEGIVTNSVVVAGADFDPDSDNNRVDVMVSVEPASSLRIRRSPGGGVEINWLQPAGGAALLSSDVLGGALWSTWESVPVAEGGPNRVIVEEVSGARFFRLLQP
jgi:large repetitive protein